MAESTQKEYLALEPLRLLWPESSSQNFLDLNQQFGLEDLEVFQTPTLELLITEKEDRLPVKVFPGCRRGDLHRLVWYVCLVGVVDSPLNEPTSLQARIERAMQQTGLEHVPHETKRKVAKTKPLQANKTEVLMADLVFEPESLGLKYLMRVLAYQRNIVWQRINLQQLLDYKVWKDLYQRDFGNDLDPRMIDSYIKFAKHFQETTAQYQVMHEQMRGLYRATDSTAKQAAKQRKIEGGIADEPESTTQLDREDGERE